MDNLDAELRLLLLQHNEQQKERALNPADTEGSSPALSGEKVRVFLTYQDDLKPIQDLGYELRSFTDNMTSGDIPVEHLAAIAAHPNVLQLAKVGRNYPRLNDSIPDIHANQVWSRSGDTFSGFTGRGVIIAIIDSGIDFKHPNFRHIGGEKLTRILSIWDQNTPDTTHPDSGMKPPLPVNGIAAMYGTEYDSNLINKVLKGEVGQTINQKDIDGHGTHVAGIAAGNGVQNGNCHGAFTYIGVAPEADLIIVKLKNFRNSPQSNLPADHLTDENITDAIRYIITRAAGRKVVFNMSFGNETGSRDGKSAFEKRIDQIVNAAGDNVLGVVAASNAGSLEAHAQGIVPQSGHLELKFEQTPTSDEEFIEIWYPLSGNLTCTITPKNGVETQVIGVNDIRTFSNINGQGGDVSIMAGVTNFVPATSTTSSIPANARQIVIKLTPRPAVPAAPPVAAILAGNNLTGEWVIKFSNGGVVDVPFHAWVTIAAHSGTKFNNLVSNQTTIGQPECADSLIAVGNYQADRSGILGQLIDIFSLTNGDLADSSGRGPSRDGTFQKPDICAPGVAINSTNVESDDRLNSCCCNCCKDFYQQLGGTSMAAPHVTGTMALMWHKNNTQTALEIKQHLIINARRDGKTGPDINSDWGAGKLEAKVAVDAVPPLALPVAPPVVTPFMASRETPQYNPLQTLQERFLASPKGGYLLRVGQKHFNEIRNLINANKRVATVWHRCQGPAWLRTGFSILSMPDMVIPEAIANVKLTEAVRKLTEILTRYGSPELVKDIEMYQPDLQILRGGISVFDLAENFDIVTK